MDASITLDRIMTRDVITVSPDLTLREAASLFAGRHISGAPVVEGDRVVGVISVSDIIDFIASTPPVPTMQPHAEWGEFEPEPEEESADDEGGQFFHDLWPDSGADVLERFMETGSPEWDLLAEHTVGSIMTESIEHLPPDADAAAAAQRLLDRGMHRILVLSDGRLEGIVTTTDLIRLVAQGSGARSGRPRGRSR